MNKGRKTKKQLLDEREALPEHMSDLDKAGAEQKKIEDAKEESEKRFRSMIENSIDVIMIVDNDGNVAYITRSVKKVFGYEPEELIGKPTFDFGHPDDLDHLVESFIKLMENPGVPVTIEFRTMHKNGNWLITEATGNNLLHVPEVGGIVVNFHDISEHKAAVDELQHEREFYRSFVESLTDWVWEIDINGLHTYSNSAIMNILGYSDDEIIDKHLSVLWENDGQFPIRMKRLKHQLKKGNGWKNFQTPYLHKNGSIIIVESTAIPIFDRDNSIIGYRGISRDISAQKHTEEEMKKRILKYRWEEGTLYIVKEESPVLSIEGFNDLLKIGKSGLIISRTPEKEFKMENKGDVEFLWLSDKSGKKALSPIPKKLEYMIENLPSRKVILIERLDYLISRNGFNNILAFVQHLKEHVVITNNIIIISIDPSTIDPKHLRQLEKEGREIEPQNKSRLPEGYFEVLKLIYEKNIYGAKPTYSEIGYDLKLSKPTARKRIRFLISNNFIREHSKGRTKVLETTERGSRLI